MRPAVSDLTAAKLAQRLAALADPQRATDMRRFFRTGEGQYGYGDRFLGVSLPQLRAAVRSCRRLPLEQVDELLASPWHEVRLAGLIVLAGRHAQLGAAEQQAAVESYLRGLAAGQINNWDLIDASAEYVLDGLPENQLAELLDGSLWQRRAAMLATFADIKRGQPQRALWVADQLLGDQEDLIRKAVGWMLREIGKRCDRELLVDYLQRNAHRMSAITLSYATEHLDADQRAQLRQLRRSGR